MGVGYGEVVHCNTSMSRAALHLPTLTFQADCGSIKGAAWECLQKRVLNMVVNT